MTARLSAPVTVASCIPPFARTNVAPMMQEKELSDPVVAGPPTLQASRGRPHSGPAVGAFLATSL